MDKNTKKAQNSHLVGQLSVAAFLAGAAHPRRQKHREMPPPGASAPAFAATVEPAFTQITSNLPPAYLQSDSSNERVLGMTCAVFPVYTLMRASILDFRPRLANRCKVLPVYALMRASILDFKPKLANRRKLFPVYTLFRASVLDFEPRLGNRCRGEWFRLLRSWRQRFSASDSNLRSCKEECFRLHLIVVAAKKNGPPSE